MLDQKNEVRKLESLLAGDEVVSAREMKAILQEAFLSYLCEEEIEVDRNKVKYTCRRLTAAIDLVSLEKKQSR